MPQTNLTKAQERAKKLGVTIKPSTRKLKKLDVFSQAGGKKAMRRRSAFTMSARPGRGGTGHEARPRRHGAWGGTRPPRGPRERRGTGRVLDSLLFEAVEFDLGVRMCDPIFFLLGRPLRLFLLLSFLNFREETRTKQARGSPLLPFRRVTHVYPKSNRSESNRSESNRSESSTRLRLVVLVPPPRLGPAGLSSTSASVAPRVPCRLDPAARSLWKCRRIAFFRRRQDGCRRSQEARASYDSMA